MSRDDLETTVNESEATKQYVSCGAVYHAIQLVWFKLTSMWLWSYLVNMKAIQSSFVVSWSCFFSLKNKLFAAKNVERKKRSIEGISLRN